MALLAVPKFSALRSDPEFAPLPVSEVDGSGPLMERVKALRRLAALDGSWPDAGHAAGLAAFLPVVTATTLLSTVTSGEGAAVSVALAGCTAVALSPRPAWRYAACCAALAIQAGRVATSFPATANHAFLQALLLGLAVLHGRHEGVELRHLLRCFRWVAVIALFAAGLQKLLGPVLLPRPAGALRCRAPEGAVRTVLRRSLPRGHAHAA